MRGTMHSGYDHDLGCLNTLALAISYLPSFFKKKIVSLKGLVLGKVAMG